MNVSLFSSAVSNYPNGCADIMTVFGYIKNGKYKDIVSSYREFKTRESKILIPCYTPSGTFNKRCIDDIEDYNGVVCLDIDFKDNQHINLENVAKTSFKCIKSLIAYHKSVGGSGYALYIQTDNRNPEHHSEYCSVLIDLMYSSLSVICDKACKDISRLRFVSYDEDIYFNNVIIPFKLDIKTDVNVKHYDINVAKDGLESFVNEVINSGIDITEDYNDWYRIAFIFSDLYGESGRNLFHGISQSYSKYSYRETDRLYNSGLRRNCSGNIADVNTFYYICSKYGLKRKK